MRKELKASASKSPELLKLIDSIQLLGLAHHFEREIEEALKDMYGTYSLVDDNDDFTNASLRFRLLRQEGYPIPSGKSPFPIVAKTFVILNYLPFIDLMNFTDEIDVFISSKTRKATSRNI